MSQPYDHGIRGGNSVIQIIKKTNTGSWSLSCNTTIHFVHCYVIQLYIHFVHSLPLWHTDAIKWHHFAMLILNIFGNKHFRLPVINSHVAVYLKMHSST